jgi:hypothetical protein
MNSQHEDHDVPYNSAYNPFPEPQTIPSGWDTNALFSTPQVDVGMDKDDSAES